MKTLHKHVIIYDAECPLCNLYTGAFIKTGMLDKNGREPYHEICNTIEFDKRRARNEIALVNRVNGEVTYGLDSLFKIIQNRFPGFRFLFQCQLFRQMMKIVYSFISFNRKVIAPGSGNTRAESCVPDFNVGYRLSFIIFSWILSSLVLSRYAELIPSVASISKTAWFLICGGQILVQLTTAHFLFKLKWESIIGYLGNMMTVSLLTSFLLLSVIYLSNGFGSHYFLIWLMASFLLFSIEHKRRVKILNLPVKLLLNWATYFAVVVYILW